MSMIKRSLLLIVTGFMLTAVGCGEGSKNNKSDSLVFKPSSSSLSVSDRSSDSQSNSTAHDIAQGNQIGVDRLESFMRNILDASTIEEAEKILVENIPVDIDSKQEEKYTGSSTSSDYIARYFDFNQTVMFGNAQYYRMTLYYNSTDKKIQSVTMSICDVNNRGYKESLEPFFSKYGDPVMKNSRFKWNNGSMGCTIISEGIRHIGKDKKNYIVIKFKK